jgi:hypothetical protein
MVLSGVTAGRRHDASGHATVEPRITGQERTESGAPPRAAARAKTEPV